MQTTNYSTIIIDTGSGVVKAGFGGEDGPRSIFNSIVGIPKMPGLMVGMEQKERYVGDEAIAKLDIMNYNSPIQRGQVSDWEKYETLMHFLFYDEMKIVPEEISVLITETPLSSKKNREKLSEMLFETFNVEQIHIANSSMLGLFSYGKTSGLILDSGFNITSSVPIYEGFPIQYATIKLDIGGEDISKILLGMISSKLDPSYKSLKGRILADDIKEKLGYILDHKGEEEEREGEGDSAYTLPDGKDLILNKELYQATRMLFQPGKDDVGLQSIKDITISSLEQCDGEIKNDVKESVCLIGGNTLLKNFPEKFRNDLSETKEWGNFNMSYAPERQFSAWIGGSIFSSLDNFKNMWVTKAEFGENGKNGLAVDSKCF